MPVFYFIISHSAGGSVQDSQLVILTHQVAELDIQAFKWNRFCPHYQIMVAFSLDDLEREEIVKSTSPPMLWFDETSKGWLKFY